VRRRRSKRTFIIIRDSQQKNSETIKVRKRRKKKFDLVGVAIVNRSKRVRKNKEQNKRTYRRSIVQKKKENRRERNSFENKSLREAITEMSSTGQPLSTKKRWMVIDKKIVFGNGVIPRDHTGNAIIRILQHMLPWNVYLYGKLDKMSNKIA